MKPEGSGPLSGRRVFSPAPVQHRAIDQVFALIGFLAVLGLVGGGIAWLWHPGAGLAASGLVLWVEMVGWSKTGKGEG